MSFNPQIRVDGNDPILFAEFVKLNQFCDAEVQEITEGLKKDGRFLYGGGAAEEFEIKVDDTQPMTFEQFQATKHKVDDLRELLGAELWEQAQPGFVYLDCAHIEICEDGEFDLIISNQEWKSPDLEKLERELYAWAVGEDLISDPDAKPETDAPVIDTTNLLTRALHTADIDEAFKMIQDALGITDGGVAGMVSPEPDEWKDATPESRQTWLCEYLKFEVLYAI